ncbi:hypothetical protein [Massilia timonae]|uniref:Uncharacterized protein n=1 Tax=Massilia timonae CCUG 45783 TaxID=883126 RepID=K9DIL8_9BURK|nr:hypothetical protein [Massilia timonae]EKU84128.1 hypothetical protein HMPREF9710_00771 [Massilia timonae CCUG 45783]
MHIHTHCPDGTDRNCSGTVRMDLPYTGLSRDDIEFHWVSGQRGEELESITITPPADPRWIAENDAHLRNEDIESIKDEGCFTLEHEDFPHHGTCAACGSSETYSEEGENITAL